MSSKAAQAEYGPYVGCDREAALSRAQDAWRAEMQPWLNASGFADLPSAPALDDSHIASFARLFATRQSLVRSMPKRGVVAEVGVLKGNFSAFMLDALEPEELHLIDLNFSRHRVRERFAGDARVRFYEGRSEHCINDLPSCDLIYVDGGHDYETVREDARLSLQKLKPGGTLIFNDYMAWSQTECRPYGVVRAVNELCVEHNLHITGFAFQHDMYCDVALKRKTI